MQLGEGLSRSRPPEGHGQNRGPDRSAGFADHQAEMSVKVSFWKSVRRETGTGSNSSKSAVRHDEGEAYVWTVREGIVRRVSVVCGLTTETGIEVRQGLKDGDSVVITPDVKLVNGGRFGSLRFFR